MFMPASLEIDMPLKKFNVPVQFNKSTSTIYSETAQNNHK